MSQSLTVLTVFSQVITRDNWHFSHKTPPMAQKRPCWWSLFAPHPTSLPPALSTTTPHHHPILPVTNIGLLTAHRRHGVYMWSWQTSLCQANTVWAVGMRTGFIMNKLVLHVRKPKQIMCNSRRHFGFSNRPPFFDWSSFQGQRLVHNHCPLSSHHFRAAAESIAAVVRKVALYAGACSLGLQDEQYEHYFEALF